MGTRKPRSASSTRAVLGAVLRNHRWAAIGLIGGSLVAGVSESTILACIAHAATAMVDGDTRLTVTVGAVDWATSLPVVLGVAAALATLRLGMQVGLAYLPSRMAADTQEELRRRVFDAYSRSAWDVQVKERDGHLQELLTNQVGQATQALLQAANLVSAGLTFLILVLAALMLGPLVALLLLVVAGLLSAVLRPLGKLGRQRSRELSAAQFAYAEGIGAAVQLAEETYSFGVAAAERQRLSDRAEVARVRFIRTQFTSRLTQGLYQGLVILLLIGALAGLYASGTGRIAALGTVVLILVRASSYGQQAQFSWQVIQQAAPFLERLADAEAGYNARPAPSGTEPFRYGRELRFDGVGFAYRHERPVLEDVSFSVGVGQAVGIVGPSGAGKSTLVQLLLRMRQPIAGRIILDDTEIDEISLDEWRRHVSYVPQESRLLRASVADNIRFARDIDEESIERAARLAHIHDEILAMPEGYETLISQRADAVSGGQRQRICLARALAGRPDVLVLDEPTSALDRVSEAAIQASLRDLHGELTIFIVAHRASLLEICDLVLQVEAGHVTVAPAHARERAAPGWSLEHIQR